jgi:hypothetical protein
MIFRDYQKLFSTHVVVPDRVEINCLVPIETPIVLRLHAGSPDVVVLKGKESWDAVLLCWAAMKIRDMAIFNNLSFIEQAKIALKNYMREFLRWLSYYVPVCRYDNLKEYCREMEITAVKLLDQDPIC